MALLEAATVTYLRTLIGGVDPYQPPALPVPARLMRIEVVREVATLVMLGTAAWLAGRDRRARFGYFLVAFGIWDLFYYAFLAAMSGWPRSLLNWDVLFLIPLPWWGPVLAPACIAALMVLGGTMLTQFGKEAVPRPGRISWMLCLAGALLALYVFMADALHAPAWTRDALSRLRPVAFDWPLFAVALALMGAPVVDLFWRLGKRP